MQDRYAGDVGDFMKISLLKTLSGHDLRLGVNWYLTPNETQNKDGRHITYLKPNNRIGQHLRQMDEDLYGALQPLGEEDANRSVRFLEDEGTFPTDTLFHDQVVARHEGWHTNALTNLSAADLVFLDPDNGLRMDGGRTNLQKYALPEEVRSYFERGQSVVVYHHADRTDSVEEQVRRRINDLSDAAGSRCLAAVLARRGTVRFFLVAAQPEHEERLVERLRFYNDLAWGDIRLEQHARVIWG